MTIWRMRIACCVPDVTNTHSEYVILIAFPLQQWLQGRALMLSYIVFSVIVEMESVLCEVHTESNIDQCKS